MLKLMRRILAAAGPYKRRIQAAFVFSFLHSLLAKAPIGLAFAVLVGFFYGTMRAEWCLWIAAGLVVCIALQCLCQNAADRLQAAAGYMVFADLRMKLGAHLRKMPMGYFTEGNIGKISSVLSTDMVFIEEHSMKNIADMMSHVFAQVILVAFLFAAHPLLGLTGALVAGIAFLSGQAGVRDALGHSAIRQEQSENLTEAVLDFTEGIGVIKSYNLLGEKSKELSENFARSCRASIEFEQSQSPAMRRLFLICGLGAAAVLLFSLVLYAQGALDAVLLAGVLLFVLDLFGPVKALFSESSRLTVMNSCMDRIEAVFAAPELPDTGQDMLSAASTAPAVEFRDVHFAYGAKEVLHGISFRVQPRQMLALVGPSGGGKSTIASLLARFWDVSGGQVCIQGKDVRSLPLQTLMEQVSMVFQRVYLFQDTIYNNICIGRPDATREEVIDAAKQARCYDFIMALPQGFDTVIGEGGASLSGGEQQRISIARCILKDAPLIILDEATASVDADNERYIQQAISALCRGKTLLVIAHRLNTIRYADQILVVSDGRIAQAGTHEELMAEDGIYRDFVAARTHTQGWNR